MDAISTFKFYFAQSNPEKFDQTKTSVPNKWKGDAPFYSSCFIEKPFNI
jgi:uncharacterized protein (DUF427 family)